MSGLTFLGLAGFNDPPRETVKKAVDTCRRARMGTGDPPGTALNITRKVKVTDEIGDLALHGQDLRDVNSQCTHKVYILKPVTAPL